MTAVRGRRLGVSDAARNSAAPVIPAMDSGFSFKKAPSGRCRASLAQVVVPRALPKKHASEIVHAWIAALRKCERSDVPICVSFLSVQFPLTQPGGDWMPLANCQS